MPTIDRMSVESAESLIQKGNQAFVDEDFALAKELYTQSLQLEQSPLVLLNRAATGLKLEEYDRQWHLFYPLFWGVLIFLLVRPAVEVIADCDGALKAKTKNHYALLRKGYGIDHLCFLGCENLIIRFGFFAGLPSLPRRITRLPWMCLRRARLHHPPSRPSRLGARRRRPSSVAQV